MSLCFKCPNYKNIIKDISDAGNRLDDNNSKVKGNQVYIEVYRQQPEKQFEAIVEARLTDSNGSPRVQPGFKKSIDGGFPRPGSDQNIIISNDTNRQLAQRPPSELLSKIEDYKQIIGKYKKTIQTMDKTNKEQEEEIRKQLEIIVNHNMEIEKYKEETRSCKNRVKEYEKESIAIKKELELMKISLEKKDHRIIELHVQTSKYEDTHNEQTAQITALNERLNESLDTFQRLQASLQDIKQVYHNKIQECSDLTATVNQLSFTKEELQTSLHVLQGKYDELKEQMEAKNKSISDLNVALAGITAKHDKALSEIEELKKMFPE
jgi:chromosome segregation ATPase